MRYEKSREVSSDLEIDLDKLNTFLKQNEAVDLRSVDLLHLTTTDEFAWAELAPDRESLIPQLKAYQRMLRVVPEGREDLAKKLLESGFHSSLQIAGTPKQDFIQQNSSLFGGDTALAEHVYTRAIALRKAVTLQYIAQVQQIEPHAHAVGLLY